MALDEFWRSTPRTVSLAIEGYRRRRGWAAWHSGAPGNFKDVTFDDMLGRPRREHKAMSADQMMKNLRRISVANNAAVAARARQRAANHGE